MIHVISLSENNRPQVVQNTTSELHDVHAALHWLGVIIKEYSSYLCHFHKVLGLTKDRLEKKSCQN